MLVSLLSILIVHDSLTCRVSNLAMISNRTWQGVQKFTTGVQCMSRSFPALHWHNSHRTNSSKSGYLGPCLVFVFGSCILSKAISWFLCLTLIWLTLVFYQFKLSSLNLSWRKSGKVDVQNSSQNLFLNIFLLIWITNFTF